VDETPVGGRNGDNPLLSQLLAHYGAPAYVRRARAAEDAWEALLERCRQQRHEWLAMVRLALGQVHALAGDWARLTRHLQDAQDIMLLQRLYAELQPVLKVPPERTSFERKLRRALLALNRRTLWFNRRWEEHLAGVDLEPINALRRDYNRYYVLEKECAMRSARLARQGFVPLEPVTVSSLAAHFPALPVVRLR
jgi:hypothetical protein